MTLHMVDCVSELCADKLVKYGRLRGPRHGLRPGDKSTDASLLHDFKWNGTHWNCMECFLRTNNPFYLLAGRSQCKGFTFSKTFQGTLMGMLCGQLVGLMGNRWSTVQGAGIMPALFQNVLGTHAVVQAWFETLVAFT